MIHPGTKQDKQSYERQSQHCFLSMPLSYQRDSTLWKAAMSTGSGETPDFLSCSLWVQLQTVQLLGYNLELVPQ